MENDCYDLIDEMDERHKEILRLSIYLYAASKFFVGNQELDDFELVEQGLFWCRREMDVW